MENSHPPISTSPQKKRLLSLDVLRGITVVGMILVNNSGGKLSYDSLQHSAWNGLTLCDLVFPFFLFIMGVSTYIALGKFHFQASGSVVRKILKRTLVILCIGWAIHWFHFICDGDFFPFAHLRLTGVLPRIALCYCVVSFVALYVNHKYIGWIIGCLIAGYAVLLCIGNGYAPDDTNLLAIIDRNVLGADHLYHKFDSIVLYHHIIMQDFLFSSHYNTDKRTIMPLRHTLRRNVNHESEPIGANADRSVQQRHFKLH